MATNANKAAVVTLKHLAAELGEKHELSKKVAVELLTDLVGLIAKNLSTKVAETVSATPVDVKSKVDSAKNQK